jgi:hypothetical protein
MEEETYQPASPSTRDAIDRLSADMEGPHLRLYRAVIEEDIRLQKKLGEESENESEDDGINPRKKIDLGRHLIEFHIYEVWAKKDGDTVKYWIFSADYIMDDGSLVSSCNEEATRAEAIAHVVEASSYEEAEDVDVDHVELDWSSKDEDGNKIADFPEECDILESLEENEWMIERDASNIE